MFHPQIQVFNLQVVYFQARFHSQSPMKVIKVHEFFICPRPRSSKEFDCPFPIKEAFVFRQRFACEFGSVLIIDQRFELFMFQSQSLLI